MKWSRYARLVEIEDGNAALAVSLLTRSVLRLEGDSLNAARAVRDGSSSELILKSDRDLFVSLVEGRFLTPPDFNENEWMRAQYGIDRDDPNTLGVVISPTQTCNMRCHYCFEKHSDVRLGTEKSDAAVEHIVRAMKGRSALHVRWFGGEPLQELPMIRRISGYLQQEAVKRNFAYSADVISNCYFLSRDTLSELLTLGVDRIQVTFDGDRIVHNRVRRDEMSGGSYDKIVENLVAASGKVRIVLRIHVAPYNMSSIEILLRDLVAKDLHNAIEQITFAPLFDYQAGAQTKKQWQTDRKRFVSSEEFASYQTELEFTARKLGFTLPDPLDVDWGICTAVRKNTLVINPDGTLSKCYLDTGDPTEAFASLFDSRQSPDKKSKWDNYDFLQDDECRECSLVPVCQGGCPKQEMDGADKSLICTPLRYNFDERISLHYQ